MKKFKLFLLFNLIIISFSSCGTIKEGFKSGKSNSGDEFLVEKKSPLVMPPDFNELPIPKTNQIKKNTEINEVETLINKSDSEEKDVKNQKENNLSFEELILKKIKN